MDLGLIQSLSYLSVIHYPPKLQIPNEAAVLSCFAMCALLPCRAARTGASGAAEQQQQRERWIGAGRVILALPLGWAVPLPGRQLSHVVSLKGSAKLKEKLFTELGNNNWVHS